MLKYLEISNIVSIFAENLGKMILESVKGKLFALPRELFLENSVYVELSKGDFDSLQKEVEGLGVVFNKKTKDFGEGITLGIEGLKVIFVSRDLGDPGVIYLAFRSKL
jgi:hypothetical protein